MTLFEEAKKMVAGEVTTDSISFSATLPNNTMATIRISKTDNPNVVQMQVNDGNPVNMTNVVQLRMSLKRMGVETQPASEVKGAQEVAGPAEVSSKLGVIPTQMGEVSRSPDAAQPARDVSEAKSGTLFATSLAAISATGQKVVMQKDGSAMISRVQEGIEMPITTLHPLNGGKQVTMENAFGMSPPMQNIVQIRSSLERMGIALNERKEVQGPKAVL